VERAEKSVRMTVSNPSTKMRIWIRLSEVDMGGIIKHDRRDKKLIEMLYLEQWGSFSNA
jgi:hypothetical protein